MIVGRLDPEAKVDPGMRNSTLSRDCSRILMSVPFKKGYPKLGYCPHSITVE